MVKVYYWFGIYKVRSVWVVADLFLSFFQLDGTFWVQEVEVYNMAANKTWYSLAEALEEHKPGEVATAIEGVGIWVIDCFGRRVIADDGDVGNIYSRQYALKLVADRYGELQNPSPEHSWESERWDVETHPTCTFGWPASEAPSFRAIADTETKNPVPWSKRTRDEFAQELKTAGSYAAAALLHGVSRQSYTKVYKRVMGK